MNTELPGPLGLGFDPKGKPTPLHATWAYRFFLGREPENKQVVERMAESSADLSSLCMKFMASEEFRDRLKLPPIASDGRTSYSLPLDWPRIDPETDVSRELLERMLQHIERNWQTMGEKEPHYSVLTHANFRPDKIDEFGDAFYKTGYESLRYFKAAVARSGRSINQGGVCFELGCGVGRITIPLASEFSKVIASDISAPHLALANEAVRAKGVSNVQFVRITSLQTLTTLSPYDHFFSVIVLQHNPPPIIKTMLQTILSRMSPGGLAYFQVPTYGLSYRFKAHPYLETAEDLGKMEVHVLPQAEVFAIARQTGCEVLEVREDGWVGSNRYVSNSFLLTKPQNARVAEGHSRE